MKEKKNLKKPKREQVIQVWLHTLFLSLNLWISISNMAISSLAALGRPWLRACSLPTALGFVASFFCFLLQCPSSASFFLPSSHLRLKWVVASSQKSPSPNDFAIQLCDPTSPSYTLGSGSKEAFKIVKSCDPMR